MHPRHKFSLYLALFLIIFFLVSPHLFAGNDVMGEVQFEGKTKVEKTSGVWIDGQYVGYLKELKGAKKVLLLPGDHTISVRQNGYEDFTQQITIHPGEKRVVTVAMQKGAAGAMPTSWAIVKIVVNPGRAAVFLDDRFVGHVGEFDGPGQSLQVAPGVHKSRSLCPGTRPSKRKSTHSPMRMRQNRRRRSFLRSRLRHQRPIARPLAELARSTERNDELRLACTSVIPRGCHPEASVSSLRDHTTRNRATAADEGHYTACKAGVPRDGLWPSTYVSNLHNPQRMSS